MGTEPQQVAAPEGFEVVADTTETLLKISSGSSAQSVASALSYALYDNRKVVLRAIGAGAVNQAVKACAIARGYVAPRGMDIAFVPGFQDVQIDGKAQTSITIAVITR